MRRTIGFIAVFILMFAISNRAQAPAAPPKPGPEVKRLAYFVGTWKQEGVVKAGAMDGPAGKFTSTDKAEWLPGAFFLVTHSDGMTPDGPDKELSVMGYDTKEKVYTYHAFDNSGDAITAKGTVTGDTWTWTVDDMMGDASTKTRVTIKQVSNTQYTFKLETSTDGNTWTTAEESTSTKVMATLVKPAASPK